MPKGSRTEPGAEHTLQQFLNKLKEKKGEPLQLLEITKPEDLPLNEANPDVYETLVSNIKQIIGKELPSSRPNITMDMKGDKDDQKLGIYAYRDYFTTNIPGVFGSITAQFVSVTYGNKGGTSAMIPLPNGAERGIPPSGNARPVKKVDKPVKKVDKPAKKVDKPAKKVDVQTSETDPLVLSSTDLIIHTGKWSDFPNPWFSSQLDQKTGTRDKIGVFLVLTTDRFWLFAVPPACIDKMVPSGAGMHPDAKKYFKMIKTRFIDDLNEKGSFANFFKDVNKNPSEEILGMVSLNLVVRGGGNPSWRFKEFYSGIWAAIYQIAKGKLAKVKTADWIESGASINPTENAFSFGVKSGQDRLSGHIIYRRVQQLTIDAQGLSDQPGFKGVRQSWKALVDTAEALDLKGDEDC